MFTYHHQILLTLHLFHSSSFAFHLPTFLPLIYIPSVRNTCEIENTTLQSKRKKHSSPKDSNLSLYQTQETKEEKEEDIVEFQSSPHLQKEQDKTPRDANSQSPEEKEFLAKTKILCTQRNLPFTKIKNARDLASIPSCPILPNRIFRTGRVSDASSEDVHVLLHDIQIKTLVDLRSPTELKEDPTLDRESVFGNFTNMIWIERKNGLVRELAPGESCVIQEKKHHSTHSHEVKQDGDEDDPMSDHASTNKSNPAKGLALKIHDVKGHLKEMVGGIRRRGSSVSSSRESCTTLDDEDSSSSTNTSNTVGGSDGPVLDLRFAADLAARTTEIEDDGETSDQEESKTLLIVDHGSSSTDEIEDGMTIMEGKDAHTDNDSKIFDGGVIERKRFVKNYPPGSVFIEDESRIHRKERHFVSMMNELKYIRGTLSKLRKRDIAKVIMKSPGAIVSKRVRSSVKDVFLDQINGGGLPLLNDLLLRFGAPAIKYVLELCADKSRHPVAFYCTAGKDRTGMIAAIILSVVGVPEEYIVEDYSLSANVYAEMNDHKAMVGALSQRSLNPKVFLGAPPHVMKETLENIRKSYGGVDEYLDFIGFGKESRQKLKEALTV